MRARSASPSPVLARRPGVTLAGPLVLAALLGPGLAWAGTPVVAEIPDLTVSAGPLAELLRWAALAEPELDPPRIAARFEAAVGVDPLSPARLRAVGVDPGKPVRLTFDDARRQLVVEVSLLDAPRARAHAEAMRARVRGATPVLGAAGYVIGDQPSETLALLVSADRATVVLGARYKPARALGSMTATTSPRFSQPVDPARDDRLDGLAARARAAKRSPGPRPPKALLGRGRVDLWAVLSPLDGVERVDVAVRLTPGEVIVEAQAALDLTTEVVVAEGLRGRAATARLVDPGAAALELRTTLTRAGMREVLSRLRVPEALASVLGGAVHAGIAHDGSAFAAAALQPKADPQALVEALRGRFTGLDLTVRDQRVVAQLGGTAAVPLAAPGAASEGKGAIAIDVRPGPLLSAVERHRALLRVSPMQLMVARVLLARLVTATQSITIDASIPSNRVEGTLRMKYTAPS